MEAELSPVWGIGQLVPADPGLAPGTAFAITDRLALTAFHCVGGRRGLVVELRFQTGAQISARCRDGDEESDLALLELLDPLPAGLCPVRLAGPASQIYWRVPFLAEGFGELRPPGSAPHALDGHIVRSDAKLFASDALQLSSPQLAANDSAHGFSGGPVLVETVGGPEPGMRAALGVVRWQNEDQDGHAVGGVFYATPISLAARRWPEVAERIATDRLTVAVPVAQGRDVNAQFYVTGDRGTLFPGTYQPLDEAFIDPRPVFNRVELDRFVGREWLKRELDEFLQAEDRGYFIIEARAGLGKTAFLAHMARSRGWICHFAELAVGTEGIIPARKNLAAQLLRTYELGLAVPDQAASRPDYLAALFGHAAAKRRKGEKIVLVVDGLDEAGTRQGENVLGLPGYLPEGAYIVCSKRPVPVRLHVQPPRQVVTIDAEGQRNTDDVRSFLESAVSSDRLRAALEAGGYSTQDLVDTLAVRSRGIWVYLHYVLEEIAAGAQPLNLEALPYGLWGYYARFWQGWKDEHQEQWRGLYLPLITTLGAVQSTVPLGMLRALAGLPPDETAGFPDQWLSFVDVQRPERRYRPYHQSFRDFLHGGEAECGSLLEDERDFVEELAEGTRRAHVRIADHYLTAWGGLEHGLPKLAEPAARDLDDRYGLRYLIQHLAVAREQDVPRVLSIDTGRAGGSGTANVWFTAHDDADDIASYVADLTLAWQVARTAIKRQLDGGGRAEGVAFEYGCALMTASVNSLAYRIASPLRAALVRDGIWSANRAVTDARRLPAREQALALCDLAQAVPPGEATALITEALQVAGTLDGTDGDRLLAAMAEGLVEGFLDQALSAARAIASNYDRAGALLRLAERLSGDERGAVVAEVLQAARPTTSDKEMRQLAWLLPGVAKLLADDQDAVFAAVLAAAQAITDVFYQALAFVNISESLPPGSLGQALGLARALPREGLRGYVLGAVAARLPEDQRAAVFVEALDAARANVEEFSRAWGLADVAKRLPEDERAAVYTEACAAAHAITIAGLRDEALAQVARRLPGGQEEQSVNAALAIARDTGYFADALADLAGRVPGSLLDRLLEIAGGITDEGVRASVLAVLAGRLPAADLGQVLQAALAMTDENSCASVLTALAGRLPAADLGQALQAALAMTDEKSCASVLTALAGPLPSGDLGQVLQAALAMTPGDSRASVLAALSERRPELLGQAFAATLAITVDVIREDRFAELGALIGRLPESERRAALTEALATSRVISDQSGLSGILATFAGRLPERQRRAALSEALDAARAITAADDRAAALARLAGAVPDDMLEDVLQAARDIADPGSRAQVYAVLAWRLPQGECDAVFAEAIEAVFASGQPAGDGALVELATRLPGDLVDPAFRAAFRIEDDYCCSKMLIELARRLGAASPADAAFTPAAEVLGEPTGLARTRSVLAGRLPATPDEWQAGFARALQVALIRYNIPHNRARVLVALVQRMPDTLLDSALDAARSIVGDYGAASMLAEVALRQPEADRGALFGEALEMAGALPDGRDRAWQYDWLADLLPAAERAPVVSEALEAARTTEGYTRVDTLGQLIGLLPDVADEALSAEALETARAITDGSDRAWALMELAGRLPASEQRPVFAEAIDAALTLADGYQRVSALQALVRQVPDEIRIDSYAAWTSLLDDAATAPRPLLWSPSGEWAVRLIDDLAGPAAVQEAWQWVSRAARWWP